MTIDMLETGQASPALIDGLSALVEEFGDDLTFSVEEIFDVSAWPEDQRLSLLDQVKRGDGDGRKNIDVEGVLSTVWNYCRNRALDRLRVISAQIETTQDVEDYRPRPLFAPEEGWALLYVAEGATVISIASQADRTCEAGDLILISGGESFFIGSPDQAYDGLVFVSIFLPRDNWNPLLNFPQNRGSNYISCKASDPAINQAVFSTFREMINVAYSDLTNGKSLQVNLIEKLLLLFDECRDDRNELAIDSRVSKACAFIQDHYTEKFSIDDLATHVGASSSTLASLFRSELNSNVTKWRDKIRMQKAKELLAETDLPVKVIASEVGYEDPLFFSRRFKKLTGWSPSQIREGKSG